MKPSIPNNLLRLLHATLALCLLALPIACSSQARVLRPSASEEIDVVYDQGQPVLHSTLESEARLTLVAYQEREALFEVMVSNGTESSFLFSPENVSVTLVPPDAEQYRAAVLHAEELADADESSLAWDSAATVATAGSSMIPGIGAFGGLAGRLVGMGIKEGEKVTKPKLNISTNYLRRHTLAPSTDYVGVVKVEFPTTPPLGSKVMVDIETAAETHHFVYVLKNIR